MTISSYRLETVAADLIEQLEGRRRSYQGRPEEWREATSRFADEAMDSVEREYLDVMGAGPLPARLRREIHETFLPRYTALSIDHNALERRGYDAWRRGDPISRIAGFLIAVVAVTVISRIVPLGPLVILGYLAAMITPFIPELRAFFYRRGYTNQLRLLLDDLGRVQSQLDVQLESATKPDLEQPSRQPRQGVERDL